ncbi:MAG TPA: hypothetical protein VJH88_03085 [Candidatus Nanoarchaeia archaeon]|nr:hypothetical protein [Candidatus Nanoarchaeia archaeon]
MGRRCGKEPQEDGGNLAKILESYDGRFIIARLRDDHRARFDGEDIVVELTNLRTGGSIAGRYQREDDVGIFLRSGLGELYVPFTAMRHVDIFDKPVSYLLSVKKKRTAEEVHRNRQLFVRSTNEGQFVVVNFNEGYGAYLSPAREGWGVSVGSAAQNGSLPHCIEGRYARAGDSPFAQMRTVFGDVRVNYTMIHRIDVFGTFERKR